MTQANKASLGSFIPADTAKRPPRQEAPAAPLPEPPAIDASAIPETPEEKRAQQRIEMLDSMGEELEAVENYQEFLEKNGLTVDYARDVVDALFTDGYYEETVPVTKRLSVTMRTRAHDDTLRLQAAFEVNRPLYQNAADEMTARYNLAASLVRIGDKQFPVASATAPKKEREDAFDTRLQYVERLSSPVFYRLTQLLARFDQKMTLIMREGVAENF